MLPLKTLFVVYALSCGWTFVSGFQTTATTTSLLTNTRVDTCPLSLHMFGPETVGIALVSAVAGAASQQPKIQELEGEVAKYKAALEQSREDMQHKIEILEDKLFEMDKAYEAQTAVFQAEYEAKKKVELAKITEKLKQDFKYKMEIEVEREKSILLAKELSKIQNVDQSAKMAEMRLRQQGLEDAKAKLQQALAKSEEELKRIQDAPKKKGFWPF